MAKLRSSSAPVPVERSTRDATKAWKTSQDAKALKTSQDAKANSLEDSVSVALDSPRIELELEGAKANANFNWDAFNIEAERLRFKLPDSKAELIAHLYEHALACCFTLHDRSYQLFQEVLTLDADHWESRIKLSWLELKNANLSAVVPLLVPVISATSSSINQKQRSYNNIVCSYFRRVPQDIPTAEKYALEGLALSSEGSPKLWETYGTLLLSQHKLVEARDSYKKAADLDPKLTIAPDNYRKLEYQLKKQQRNSDKKVKERNDLNKNLAKSMRSSRKLSDSKGTAKFLRI